jgi:hypothetical protein
LPVVVEGATTPVVVEPVVVEPVVTDRMLPVSLQVGAHPQSRV